MNGIGIEVMEYAAGVGPHKVDRAAGVIRGVKILGEHSLHGRRYTKGAMQSAVQLYDGAAVYLDHPPRPGQERSLRDQFGWLEGVAVRDAGMFGDLHYLKSHPMAEPVAEIAERRPDKMGLSHNAVVHESAGAAGTEVVFEAISRVRSVDLVCKPATTRGIFESEGGAGDEGAQPLAAKVGDPYSRAMEVMESAGMGRFNRGQLGLLAAMDGYPAAQRELVGMWLANPSATIPGAKSRPSQGHGVTESAGLQSLGVPSTPGRPVQAYHGARGVAASQPRNSVWDDPKVGARILYAH